MNRKRVTYIVAGIVALSFNAQALDIDFTLEGLPSAPGTVTGEILGLPDNGTATPTGGVEITSIVGADNVSITTPVTWDTIPSGTFTVTDGQITAADYYVYDPSETSYLTFNYAGENELEYSDDTGYVYNAGGFEGVTYGAAAAVPEPSMYGMALSLAVVTYVGWRRRSSGSNVLS